MSGVARRFTGMRNVLAEVLIDAGYMTTRDVARMLGVTTARIRQHAAAGDISPAGMAGTSAVYTVEDAEGLLSLRAERGYKVPAPVDVFAGEIVDGDGAWPPLVVVSV